MALLPEWLEQSWFGRYSPELMQAEAARQSSLESIEAGLGGTVTVKRVPIPNDCTDDFVEAFFRRPEKLLDPEVRGAQSSWKVMEAGVEEVLVGRLKGALESGEWDQEWGHMRKQDVYEGGLAVIVSTMDAEAE